LEKNEIEWKKWSERMISQHIYFLAPCLLRKFSRVDFIIAIIRGQRFTKLQDPLISVSRGFRTRVCAFKSAIDFSLMQFGAFHLEMKKHSQITHVVYSNSYKLSKLFKCKKNILVLRIVSISVIFYKITYVKAET